jgi:tRNA-2-methylthio-N6-dimethylallyladenosine synthase
MVAELSEKNGRARIINTEFPADSKFDSLPMSTTSQGYSAFLSVQEGCDKFCSFCVVPYTRGAEFSRPVAAVIAEAKSLVASGAKEITLLGQNVNAYHGEGPDGKAWSLAKLLCALDEIDGVERLRYMTSHPRDMGDDLIALHGSLPSLMPFMHLPVQSGSDRILEIMNRKHTADDYRRIIDRLRRNQPDLALSSDFIVGYPGETDAEFIETMQLVRDIGFASAYSFKYSPRPGTPATKQMGIVPEAVKDERLKELQAVLGAQQLAFNKSFIGREIPVLMDKKGSAPNQLHGRTPWMQAVHVNLSEQFLGHTVPVNITNGFLVSLTGDLAHRVGV